MNLKSRINEDLKSAMKAREALRLSTLRLTSSAITYAEKDKRRELNEEELVEVVSHEVKKRREAVAEYSKAGRIDLADKEQAEAEILLTYLPEQLTEEEIKTLVQTVIAETGAEGPGDMGRVMGAVIKETKGRADGKKVNELVRAMLS